MSSAPSVTRRADSRAACGILFTALVGLILSPFASAAALNTFISDSIEIDQANLGSTSPEDANLFVGTDPADGSASYAYPPGGPGSYIDWENLGGDLVNHRLLDLNNSSGKDPSSFPQSNECVGASQVLSKMDLTYVASANNNTFAYFAVQRANNNGDAGYYWLFTKLTPHLNAGQAPCKSTQSRLVYDLSGPVSGKGGDILLAGHFHPNGTPLLRVFRAKKSANGVTAVNAIDFTDQTQWQEETSAVSAVAINTTITAPGAFGKEGVLAITNSGQLEAEIFAEAAVPLSLFTSGSNCGATYYGSVITRSSGSGGTSPDLKDLAGPALFNFGTITPQAELTPTCELKAGYKAGAIGPDTKPLGNVKCEWTFDNGTTSMQCMGDQTFAAGAHTGTVKVTDLDSGCQATITTAAVQVYPPLAVTPSLTGSCASTFSYDATPSGGSGSVGYSWAFTSATGTPTPGSSASKSGTVTVNKGGVSYTGEVTVTDLRTDGPTCTATGSTQVTPYLPLSVDLIVKASPPACPAMASDAVTYEASPSGGSGSYNYTWNGAPLCSGTSCIVDPADTAFCYNQTLSVKLEDSNGVCPAVTSAPRTYSKVTTVNANSKLDSIMDAVTPVRPRVRLR